MGSLNGSSGIMSSLKWDSRLRRDLIVKKMTSEMSQNSASGEPPDGKGTDQDGTAKKV